MLLELCRTDKHGQAKGTGIVFGETKNNISYNIKIIACNLSTSTVVKYSGQ